MNDPAPAPRPYALVDRVQDAIDKARPDYNTAMARAAIREVAAWLNERDTEVQFDPNCLEAPTADEAIGWLYDEANR